jgi:hypothetical protein
MAITSVNLSVGSRDALTNAELPRIVERIPIRRWLRLSYRRANGRRGRIWVRAHDMSGSGVLVESLLPIGIGSSVFIHSTDLLVGTAHVRYCSWRGCKFKIGFELAVPLQSRF